VISEDEWLCQHAATVEVIMPDPHVQPEHEVGVEETVGSTDPAPSASSAAVESTSLVEKAISALPADLATQAIDLKRKARSQDPGMEIWVVARSYKELRAMYFLYEGDSFRN
jgi:hypothetical protein